MAQRTPGADIEPYKLEFTGSGGEFFRVWIVNLLLTIVTFGFYTPFARRRTAQYFYSHTIVADSPLEFVAQQRKMVLGFLILVFLYVVFNAASEAGEETIVIGMSIAAALLAPYFWASAMRFRFNATRWRGVRLQFTAGWGEVYRASWPVFVVAGIWIAVQAMFVVLLPQGAKTRVADAAGPIITLVLLAVALSVLCFIRLEFNYKSLVVARGRIGGQPGRWKPVFGDFVRIWLAALGVFVLSMVAIGVLAFVALGGTALLAGVQKGSSGFIFAMVALTFIGLLSLYLILAPALAYREARMFRLVWSNIGVSRIARFKSDLRARSFVGLRVVNMVLTVLTLGLFRPFAMVREYRMKTESVTLHVKGGLDQLAGQLSREEQGLGDALADMAGLDLVG